jgi:hypothetical protein
MPRGAGGALMPAALRLFGIQELKIALTNLPTDLKAPASKLVLDTAYAAAAEIEAAYPIGPGNSKNGRKIPPGQLKRGVKVRVLEFGPNAVAAQVRSTAPHAWWHEHGDRLHERETKQKAKRGRMFSKKGIPRPVFVPTMIRYRRAMYFKLAEIIKATGLDVKLEG